jgi:integrase
VDWTWHDLRRTCRTLLARIGTDDLVAELILNHVLPGKLRRTYVLHRYENEMPNVVRLRPAG